MTPVPLFRVEAPGLLTTVQDLGRWGHQQDGMTVAGAIDPFAASVANLLVGNPRGEAVLEITLLGPQLFVLSDIRIALCGGDLTPTLDGEPIALWKTRTLHRGQTLAFGRRRSGARAYLAIPGGFSVPQVLGSRATFLRGRIGGLNGRPLQRGDVLEGYGQSLIPGERGLPLSEVPTYVLPAVLRVVPGPHSNAFTEESRAVFFSSPYTLTPQSDRQGYRLNGPVVARTDHADLLSEAMPLGGVQIPPDGQPILLMADRQTTGGYPLIGTVISADLPQAGQLAPGDPVRFQAVELLEARELALRQERWLQVVGQGQHQPLLVQRPPE